MLPMLGLRGNVPGPVRAGEPPGHGGAPAAEGAAQGGRHLQGDRRQEEGGGEQGHNSMKKCFEFCSSLKVH